MLARRNRRNAPSLISSRRLATERLEDRCLLYGGSGLQFNVTATATTPQYVQNAFQVAANQWSAILTDDILVNVTIDYTDSAAGLGQALPISAIKSLTEIRNALIGDRSSLADNVAVAHLPAGSSAALYTTDFASGSPLFDNNATDNNSAFVLTRANAKALGLRAANDSASDGTIRFFNKATFDFDPSDGITAGQYDFIAVAMHEIGHFLGFESGADTVDYKSKPNGPGYSPIATVDGQIVAKPLDLFRHSAGSIAVGADFDLRADTAAKFFSIDGGATNLASFSTGKWNGNGSENQHWLDNQGLGLMDPTIAKGEYGRLSRLDVQALDVIGWSVAMDYGDAPDSAIGAGPNNLQTSLADDGPRHMLFDPSGLISDPTGAPKVLLGSSVDRDLLGQPSADANGDDTTGADDEDGIAAMPNLVAGSVVNVTVSSTASASKNAKLNYFVDFNRNGVLDDPGEAFSITLTSPTQSAPIVVPLGALPGNTFARFRISSAGNLGPTGPANDGEVEDYSVTIVAAPPSNVAPSNFVLTLVNSIVPQNSGAGGIASLSGSFSDPNAGDAHLVKINWGDGSPVSEVYLAAGVLNFSNITHAYADPNGANNTTGVQYAISASVADLAAATANASTAVWVDDPPKIVDMNLRFGPTLGQSYNINPSAANRTLPWINIKAVDVLFSEDVSASADMLGVTDVRLTQRAPLPVGIALATPLAIARVINPVGTSPNTIRWVFNNPLPDRQWRLTLDNNGIAADGHDGIHDANNLMLAGANLRDFDVLWGDFGMAAGESYGRLTTADVYSIYYAAVGQTPYSIFADLDGDGTISFNPAKVGDLTTDVGMARSRYGFRIL